MKCSLSPTYKHYTLWSFRTQWRQRNHSCIFIKKVRWLRLKYIHFNMIILKARRDVFELNIQYQYNVMWWNCDWVFKENAKPFVFKYFPKTEVYLEPSQISQMRIFVKIVNGLMPFTIFTKSSILYAWLSFINATKVLKPCVRSNFLAVAATLLNIFSY